MYGYPPRFEYWRPDSLGEAAAFLADHREDAVALAGGMSVLPRLKARAVRPRCVVDIGRLGELAGGAHLAGDSIVIGALTTHADLARAELVSSRAGALAEAAGQIGDPQVRNAGTIGGSVGEVYPGADLPGCLLALGARLRCTGPKGTRTVPVAEQFGDGDRVATGGGELVVAVEVPAQPPRSGGAHVRLERRAGVAVVGATAQVTLDEAGRYARVRAALTALRPGPVGVLGDGTLQSEVPGAEVHREAARSALEGLWSYDDVKGSAGYRLDVAAAVLARALDRAGERATRARGGDA